MAATAWAIALFEAGYVNTIRVGRRNHYTVDLNARMRHPAQLEYEIGELLDLLRGDESGDGTPA